MCDSHATAQHLACTNKSIDSPTHRSPFFTAVTAGSQSARRPLPLDASLRSQTLPGASHRQIQANKGAHTHFHCFIDPAIQPSSSSCRPSCASSGAAGTRRRSSSRRSRRSSSTDSPSRSSRRTDSSSSSQGRREEEQEAPPPRPPREVADAEAEEGGSPSRTITSGGSNGRSHSSSRQRRRPRVAGTAAAGPRGARRPRPGTAPCRP